MPPRRSRSMTPEDQAIESFNKNFDALTKRSALSLGQPPGTRPVGDAELVHQWGIMDSKVDRAQLAAQLLTTGLPPELLDPNSPNKLEIVKAAPDLAPLYAQPVKDPELADILAGFAERPFRYGILSAIDDPEDQVKEAERLSRLHDQQTSAALEAALAEQPASSKAAPMSAPMSSMSTPAPAMSAPMSASTEPPAPATLSAPVLPDQSMTMGG
jgi:hypothetical protein